MLVHVNTLSLWEIAHYWHDCDPRASNTHQIPLEVRDTLLVLIKTPNKKFSVFVEKRKAYLFKFFRYIQEVCTESFLQNLQKSIEKKLFDKRLFNSMLITRNTLACWCIENNEPLPKFWFPDNDKYTYDLENQEMEDADRYEFLLVYDGVKKTNSESEVKQPVSLSVSSNAIKAAKVKPGESVNFNKLVALRSAFGVNCAESAMHLKAFYNKPRKQPIKANGGNSFN